MGKDEISGRQPRLYHDLYDFAPVGYFILDQRGLILEVNLAGAELLGMERYDLIEKEFSEFIAPDFHELFYSHLVSALESKIRQRCELKLLKKDGMPFYVRLESVVAKDAAAKDPDQVWTAIIDIDEHKRTEEMLQKSEKHYRILADNIADVISTMDKNFQITYVSPSVEHLRGYTAEEATGQHLKETLTPSSFDLIRKEFAEIMASKESDRMDRSFPKTLELEQICKDGSTVWAEVKVSILRDEDNRPIGFLSVTRDITEKKLAEQQQQLLTRVYKVLSSRKPGKTLEEALEALEEVIAMDSATLLIWKPGKEKFDVSMRWVRDGTEVHKLHMDEEMYESYTDTVLQTGKPLYIPDTAYSPYLGDDVRARYGWHTTFVIPLIMRDDFKALLVLQSRKIDAFPEKDRNLISNFLPGFAAAVDAWHYEKELQELNASLEKRVQQRTFELEILYELSKKMGYTLSYPELFQSMLEHLRQAISYDVAASLIMNEQRGELFMHSLRPITSEVQIEVETRLLEALSLLGNQVIDQDKLKVTSIPSEDFKEGRPPIARLGTIFQVPFITSQKKMVGIFLVGLEEEKNFSEDQKRFLYTVANHTAISIERLRIFLTAEQERLEGLIENLPEGVLLLDAEKRIVLANPAARVSLAMLTTKDVGEHLTHLGNTPIDRLFRPHPEGRSMHEIVVEGPPKQIFEVASNPIKAGPQAGDWVLVIRNLTQERVIQERMQQQDRLAAVGQLAAGIAHDFNNLLTGMIGYAQLGLMKKDVPAEIKEGLEIIVSQGNKASQLIRQILDFSRKSITNREPLDLYPFLKEMVKVLKRTIPEHIKVELCAEPGTYLVYADISQIQQVVTNLAVNARDAMPEGGTLHIRLSRINIEPGDPLPTPGITPGRWIVLTLSDTGTGIPPEHMPHLFEPFFTTKGPGKGTGLGLSQVYGIVKQHEGFIDINSQVGKGTTVTIYIPAFEIKEKPIEKEETEVLPMGHGETILLVEDDEQVLRIGQQMLEALRYKVITAKNGREGLTIYTRYASSIKLVITDIVMPEMGGVALLQALKELDPRVRVMVITGYPLEKEHEKLLSQGIMGWLMKPLRLEELAHKVRKAIENPKTG